MVQQVDKNHNTTTKYSMPARSQKQKNFFYAVKNCQENGKCPSKKIKNVADSMSSVDVEKFTHLEHGIMSFKEYVKKRNIENKCKCPCKECKNNNCKNCKCKNCNCKS